jgi:hypothetical protein
VIGAAGGSNHFTTYALATPAHGTLALVNGVETYTAGTVGSTAGATLTDTVTVTDDLGNTGSAPITIGPPLAITSASGFSTSPRGSLQLGTSGGGSGPMTWSVQAGGEGGRITAGGLYTAGTVGNRGDTVSVVDSLGNSASATISVGAGLSISPANPSIAPNDSISFVPHDGSTLGYQFSLATGAHGTITAAGAYSASATANVSDTVQLTDSLGNTATTTVHVGPGVSISPSSATIPPGGTITLTAAGGNGSYTFTIVGGTPASGDAALTANGATASYTAGHAGGVTDQILVTDGTGKNSATATLSIGAGISIDQGAASASVKPGGSVTLTATGGDGGPYTWSVTDAGIGGFADPTSGVYGAGRDEGGKKDTITARDSLGNSQTIEVDVGPNIAIAPRQPGRGAARRDRLHRDPRQR